MSRCFLSLAIVTACLTQTRDVATAQNNSTGRIPAPGGGKTRVSQSGPISCTFTLLPTSFSFVNSFPTSGFGQFGVQASDPSCVWTVMSNDSWITITSVTSSSGTAVIAGNGVVTYNALANSTAAPRTGTVTAAGQTFTIQEPSDCAFGFSGVTSNLPADAGTGSFVLIASDPSCPWTISVPQGSFLTITSGTSGTGGGTVNYSFSANTSGLRNTIINVLNTSNPTQNPNLTFFQAAAPTSTPTPTPIPPSATFGLIGLAGLGFYQLRRFCQ